MPTHADEKVITIHADEVIYHPDIGEIETRGDAKVTTEKAKQALTAFRKIHLSMANSCSCCNWRLV